MAFKLSKEQVTERDTVAAEVRKQGAALNIAIAAFNQAIEPFSQAVGEALEAYNAALERARTLADGIVATAQAAFDAKSGKWQESDRGIQVRVWIEQWEVSLDDLDLELPAALSEVACDEQAGALEDAPPGLTA